jgi:hypothetical protein
VLWLREATGFADTGSFECPVVRLELKRCVERLFRVLYSLYGIVHATVCHQLEGRSCALRSR